MTDHADTIREEQIKPTMAQAEQAAELLGVDVFDLMWALRDKAQTIYESGDSDLRDFDMPNMGRCRAFMWAAQACDAAYREVQSVTESEIASA